MGKINVVNQEPASKAKRLRQLLDSMVGLPDSITRQPGVSMLKVFGRALTKPSVANEAEPGSSLGPG
jgi:hypothetical protein